jgi:serine/threonine protein phosphatase PrpC
MAAAGYAGRSDPGRNRSSNQDRWGADAGQGLFMVADGVASSSDGALAAELVIELLPTYVARHLKPDDLDDDRAAQRLVGALAQLSDDLHAQGRADARLAGATSTAVTAVVTDSRALIGHLGDSRAYLYRHQQLQRLTADHSLIEELIKAGEVDAADAAEHPARSVLTRHVAMAPPALPDVATVDLRPGDRILLCSDGLHGVVEDASLAQILGAHRDPGGACDALIGAANDAGGPDNITAVVIDIAGTDAAPGDCAAAQEVS